VLESSKRRFFEACEKCNRKLHAFVVMSDYYRMVLDTPEANLVKGKGGCLEPSGYSSMPSGESEDMSFSRAKRIWSSRKGDRCLDL